MVNNISTNQEIPTIREIPMFFEPDSIDLSARNIDTAIVTDMRTTSREYISLSDFQNVDLHTFKSIPQKHMHSTKWILMYEGDYAAVATIVLRTRPITGEVYAVILRRELVEKTQLGVLRCTAQHQYIADYYGGKLLN